jgi:phospholipid/cholesterol/gamma-HCH transport system substrate-binding protein
VRLPQNRVRALAAAAAAVIVAAVAVLVFTSGDGGYRVRAIFSNASGLVGGDQVMIGPTAVGSVAGISLTKAGKAAVTLQLNADAAPVHRGTVARIAENGLAGIASHYVTLEPARTSAPAIPTGGELPERDTHAEVGLDQLFDTLNAKTRSGLSQLIKGEATSTRGRVRQARATLKYLAPALASTSQLTAQLDRYEPAFDGLLVQGARTMRALAEHSEQLSDLVAKTDTATGTLAGQSEALKAALSLLPQTLTRSSRTLAGLRQTLDTLGPVVAAATPGARRLPQLAVALARFERTATPTLTALVDLISGPSSGAGGYLTRLLRGVPTLARASTVAFPALIKALNASQTQVVSLRNYAPDIVAALADLGQVSSNYDGNGHYVRVQPFFGAFGLDSSNTLQTQPPADRYNGLQVVSGRCPGGAVQPAPDRSAPRKTAGCKTSATPPGP